MLRSTGKLAATPLCKAMGPISPCFIVSSLFPLFHTQDFQSICFILPLSIPLIHLCFFCPQIIAPLNNGAEVSVFFSLFRGTWQFLLESEQGCRGLFFLGGGGRPRSLGGRQTWNVGKLRKTSKFSIFLLSPKDSWVPDAPNQLLTFSVTPQLKENPPSEQKHKPPDHIQTVFLDKKPDGDYCVGNRKGQCLASQAASGNFPRRLVMWPARRTWSCVCSQNRGGKNITGGQKSTPWRPSSKACLCHPWGRL